VKPGRLRGLAFPTMRTGIYLFLIWGVPVITTGALLTLAYSRRSAAGGPVKRR